MLRVLRQSVKPTAIAILRERQALRTALVKAAADRRRALVLCYHTVEPAGGSRVVPALHPDKFVGQIDALKSIGDVVPLDWLLQPHDSTTSRPRFAITFDDDDPAHVRQVLPILRKQQIHATFFLSGRALHGLGAYWWTRLEQSVRTIGLSATCRALNVYAPTMKELVRRCRDASRVAELPDVDGETLGAGEIRLLADAGMTIGFHTLHHPALTRLRDADLSRAITYGRDALAAATGSAIELFAYPYGTVDRRVADMVRAAGYKAAFALGNRSMSCWSDRFCTPRWQPASAPVPDMPAEAALRLLWRPVRAF
jgi:peptidoglycan/xylan/chitin deacetylase (PgdA/CDA1 family)